MSEAIAAGKGRRRSPSPSPTGRFIVFLAVFLSFVLVLYVLVVTVVLPRLRISRVIVQADFEMDRHELLSLAGIGSRTYYFNVDETAIAERLESFAPIRTATVQKEFPQTVILSLTRRRPLVLAIVGEGRSEAIAIDESGTIFAAGHHVAGVDLPILSGLSFQGNVVGSKLPDSMDTLLESLFSLRIDHPELYETISEVRIDAHRAGRFDILIFFHGLRVPVRVDSAVDKETCTYALMVLDVLQQQGVAPTVEEIDFRSGEIVYRMKEGIDAGE